MQTASDVGYSHDNDADCHNTLCRERPFGMQVSKNTGVMTRVHTRRDSQAVMLNQDGGASIAARLADRWLEKNP